MVLTKTAVLLQKQQLMFFVYILTEPNTRFKESDKNNLRFELFFWLFDRWLSGRLELELLSSYGETDGAIFLLTSIIDILAGTAASSCSSSPPCSRFLNMGKKLENLTLQITMASALHHYHTQAPPPPPPPPTTKTQQQTNPTTTKENESVKCFDFAGFPPHLFLFFYFTEQHLIWDQTFLYSCTIKMIVVIELFKELTMKKAKLGTMITITWPLLVSYFGAFSPFQKMKNKF